MCDSNINAYEQIKRWKDPVTLQITDSKIGASCNSSVRRCCHAETMRLFELFVFVKCCRTCEDHRRFEKSSVSLIRSACPSIATWNKSAVKQSRFLFIVCGNTCRYCHTRRMPILFCFKIFYKLSSTCYFPSVHEIRMRKIKKFHLCNNEAPLKRDIQFEIKTIPRFFA